MANRFRPRLAGYRELMKSGAMQGLVTRAAEEMADMASGMCSTDPMDNQPFSSTGGVDDVAAWASAFTSSPHGERAQNRNKVLTKAFKSVKV